ncbi:LamB/YcsF family protein [Undibacter mobilis]|uniref:LamB/YcsF family protein n=1 Tax=Undibacter mobilis TaxID=2292256 RepID=A0A371B2P6_9BRAD|nr:5-oxoprolinase subunit PxpA [Undibacter mobilis]RDV01820.1 LamB/YcsF family protein [Undibacter mobilis]
MPLSIDINGDAGESYGRWTLGDDASFLPHVSSVNIACGFHGGDPATMRETVRIAKRAGIAIGAHPSFPDLMGFGRRMMTIAPDEMVDYTLYQLGALTAIARTEGLHVAHVKPHGAFYKACSIDMALSKALGAAIAAYDPQMFLVLLAGPGADAAEAAGARVAREAFIDLDYDADGGLIIERVAKLRDPGTVAQRALRIIHEGKLSKIDGSDMDLKVSTLCLHGDRANSAEVARVVKETLQANGIAVSPLR